MMPVFGVEGLLCFQGSGFRAYGLGLGRQQGRRKASNEVEKEKPWKGGTREMS